MKKSLILLTLGLSLLVGCQKNDESSNKEKETTIFAIHLGKALDPNLPVFKKAAEDTGINLKNVASKNQTNEIEAYNLMLTSKKLPDIIAYGYPSELENLGIEGGLIPLDDLIKKYAPHIQKFFDENPRYLKDAKAVDGHIYMIPNYYDYFNLKTSQALYIRKDWLKKLNLKEPKTVDELHDVLVAFRDKDPNGNGKKDEVPLFLRGIDSRAIIESLVDIFKASVFWHVENGKVVYGPSEEGYKDAIIQISKWYKEGLIDSEIFTRGMSSRDYMLSNNLGGFTSDWIASTSSYNTSLKDKIKGFDFDAILPVIYKGNNKTYFERPTYEGGWGISKDAKDPVSIIKYFDYWYTDEGRRLWNYGIENVDYTMENGVPKFTDKVLKDPDGRSPLAVLRAEGAQYRLGMFQDYRYEYGWASKDAIKNYDLYRNANVIVEGLPLLKYTKEDSQKFVRIDAALRSYVEEKTQSWILGSSNINDEWDEYIKKLNSLGLKEAEEIQNKAYESYNK